MVSLADVDQSLSTKLRVAQGSHSYTFMISTFPILFGKTAVIFRKMKEKKGEPREIFCEERRVDFQVLQHLLGRYCHLRFLILLFAVRQVLLWCPKRGCVTCMFPRLPIFHIPFPFLSFLSVLYRENKAQQVNKQCRERKTDETGKKGMVSSTW